MAARRSAKGWVAASIAAFLALSALGTAWEGAADEMAPADSAVAVLVIGGLNQGYLEPCGCAEGMLGGLARRAAALGQLRRRLLVPLFHLDQGDWSAGVDLLQSYKIDATLQALSAMGTAALRPGLRDVALGIADMADRAHALGLPLVAADLSPREPMPGLRPLRSLGISVAGESLWLDVTSLADPGLDLEWQASLGDGWSIAADSAWTAFSQTPALKVVLFGGSRETARAFFALRPVDLVISGESDPLPYSERLPHGGLLVGLGDKGQYLAEVGLVRGEGGRWTFVDRGAIPLSGLIPDDPAVRAILDAYEAVLRRDNLAGLLTSKPKKVMGGHFIGSSACLSCHSASHETWAASHHATGLETLERLGKDGNPDCLRCHTVGFGFEGGFESRQATPDLAGIGCESCHGVGSQHIEDPSKDYGQVGKAGCLLCHDPRNSPRFDFDLYWAKIRHGR